MLHIATYDQWAEAQATGTYSGTGGIVYGCSSSQLAMVVKAHFPDIGRYLVLSVDLHQVNGEVRFATFREGGISETFPHLHGTFPASAVLSVSTLEEALAAQAADQSG